METTKNLAPYGSLGRAVRDRIADVFGPTASIVDAFDSARRCDLVVSIPTPYSAQTSQGVGLWVKVADDSLPGEGPGLCRSTLSVGVLDGGVTPALSTETDEKIRPFLGVPNVRISDGEIAFSTGRVTSYTLDFARDVRDLAERLLELAEPVDVDSERAYFGMAE